MKLTEKDLASAGLVVNGNTVEKADPAAIPDASWDLARLEAAHQEQERAYLQFAKKAAEHYWRWGRVLSAIRAKLKEEGRWVAWLKNSGVKRDRVYMAINLFHAATEDDVMGKPITEALVAFGILARPKQAVTGNVPIPDNGDLAEEQERGQPARKSPRGFAPEDDGVEDTQSSQEPEHEPVLDATVQLHKAAELLASVQRQTDPLSVEAQRVLDEIEMLVKELRSREVAGVRKMKPSRTKKDAKRNTRRGLPGASKKARK